ncbi:uncharacterized protein LOC132613284 [Lycium barbarum]|uniref:uncharacterized protein LOC132613284 n=1 Tax=Lycium barbarum TaxID=112863 RepID=UPI00293E5A8D|nr:uncharacterized protein LOC132613284 [Lycium barbarum]
MKHAAHEANIKASDGLSPSKSRELYAEVRTLKEILTNKQEELKKKDSNIKSLKLELEKAKKCELKLLEKDASLGKVKEEFSHVKAFKIRVTDWLSDFRRSVQELEDELENRMLSESRIFDAWLSKTKQFLNHSCSGEISNSIEKEIKNLKSELELAKENEKIASSKAKALNDKMKLANEAEENSRKEVATMKEMIKSIMARNKMFLDEAKKKKLYRNTTERLKLQAEESLLAWNERELSFIACIKELQEERDLALHEVT